MGGPQNSREQGHQVLGLARAGFGGGHSADLPEGHREGCEMIRASVVNSISINVGMIVTRGSASVNLDGSVCLYMAAPGHPESIFLHGTQQDLLDFADSIINSVIPQKTDAPEDGEVAITSEGVDASGMNE